MIEPAHRMLTSGRGNTQSDGACARGNSYRPDHRLFAGVKQLPL